MSIISKKIKNTNNKIIKIDRLDSRFVNRIGNFGSALYRLNNDVGLVISIADGIVGIQGLGSVANGEMIDFLVGSKKISGMILNLEVSRVSAVVLGDDSEIKPVNM